MSYGYGLGNDPDNYDEDEPPKASKCRTSKCCECGAFITGKTTKLQSGDEIGHTIDCKRCGGYFWIEPVLTETRLKAGSEAADPEWSPPF